VTMRIDVFTHFVPPTLLHDRSVWTRSSGATRVEVPIAADESIREADGPLRMTVAEAADVAVLKCAPLGGVRRAREVAEAAGLPCVVARVEAELVVAA
jgi:O-succinylbenzoate synthase